MAILGLGRSGVSAAKAALAIGDIPRVYDENPANSPNRWAAKDELQGLGVAVSDGWSGAFEEGEVIASPGVPRTNAKLLDALRQGRSVISEIEYAYRISKAPIVAITGTNGKSTTTAMTYLCLKACGENAVLCGNIYGSGFDEIPLTEAAAKAKPEDVLVAEVSSFQLEWVSQFRPVSAGITNIWPDHLDRYEGSLTEYAAVKQRIFAAQGVSDFAVVRTGDPVVKAPHGHGKPHVLSFGENGEHAQVSEEGVRIFGRFIPASEFPRREPHNLMNSAMAGLLAFGYLKNRASSETDSHAADLLNRAEIDSSDSRLELGRGSNSCDWSLPEEIVDGLKSFMGLAHRMELVGTGRGVTVINNSMCTNVDAIIKSASGVHGTKHILMGGINKGLDFRPLKTYLASHGDHVYLYGRDRAQLGEVLGGPVFATMQEAFQSAAVHAKAGETILLAPGCASMDQFEDFRERGDVFKQIALEWLAS